MLKTARLIVRNMLLRAGWEHVSQEVYNNAYDALFGRSSLVEVPINECVDKLGFSYGGWHAWVETAKCLIEAPDKIDYESSSLSRFYQQWSFPLLSEVFANEIKDEKIRNHFLKLFHGNFLPFCDETSDLESRIIAATRYLELESENVGYRLSIDQSINLDGTWTNEKGRIELERLGRLIDSIKLHGYKKASKPDEDILSYALERDRTFKYVIVSGLHRLSVLSALGHKTITVRLFRNIVVNPHTIDHWPLVRQGVYSRESALAYFNHLFDFDSYNWAQTHFKAES